VVVAQKTANVEEIVWHLAVHDQVLSRLRHRRNDVLLPGNSHEDLHLEVTDSTKVVGPPEVGQRTVEVEAPSKLLAEFQALDATSQAY